MSTNLTRRAISADKNSVQSRLSSILTEPLPPQALDGRDPLLERHGGQVFPVHLLGLAKARSDTHDPLDHPSTVAALREVPQGIRDLPTIPGLSA